METSIIIRFKNEKDNLHKLFKILKKQSDQSFEIIIVNNNSTDGSENVVYDYFHKIRIKEVNIKNFSYPKACNLGAEKANSKYLVFLSAHSYPISYTWLADGLLNFRDKNVAGVSAFPLQKISDTTFAEFICYAIPNIIRTTIRNTRQGEIANTNSIIRYDFWRKHMFDEKLTKGLEDYEWSRFWKNKKYKIVNDPKFGVFHSHHLGFREIKDRQRSWRNIKTEIESAYKLNKTSNKR